MAILERGLDDIGGNEAQSQHTTEVRRANTHFGGQFAEFLVAICDSSIA